jgi:hypothetical protein
MVTSPIATARERPGIRAAGCDYRLVLLKLTGSACSGKTTVARACASVDRLVVHDFDEIGVPSDADKRWRQAALEQWIERALEYQRRGLSVLLTGQSPLGEVLASPSAPLLDGIAVCLLDVEDGERLLRLERRDPERWDEATQEAFIAWAQWHREHAVDPRSRPEVIIDGGWENMRWERWSGWTPGDSRWNTIVIANTDRQIDHTVGEVKGWIDNARARLERGTLPLASGWA